MAYKSWGNYPKTDENIQQMSWRDEELPTGNSVLPYGHGRSYGDSCLNDGGVLLDTTKLDRFIAFDAETGVLRTEAGVSLEQILKFAVPKGWFCLSALARNTSRWRAQSPTTSTAKTTTAPGRLGGT